MARTFAGGDLASTPSDLRTSPLPEHDHGYELADDIDRRNGWLDGAEKTQPQGVDALGMFFRWLVDQERLSLKQTSLRALAAVYAIRPDLLEGKERKEVARLIGADERTFRRAAESFRKLIDRP